MPDATHLRFARELEERDARIAAELETVLGLQADAEELRAHAEAAASFLAAQPLEQARLREAVAAAREELDAREAERADAEAELERARNEEEAAAARRRLTRATDAATAARRQLERVVTEAETLEREAARIEEELPRLERRAAELDDRLAERSRVARIDVRPAGLDSVLEWAARARAALFVAVGGLETERERVVREANELGAAALGEPELAASVAVVRARIERAIV